MNPWVIIVWINIFVLCVILGWLVSKAFIKLAPRGLAHLWMTIHMSGTSPMRDGFDAVQIGHDGCMNNSTEIIADDMNVDGSPRGVGFWEHEMYVFITRVAIFMALLAVFTA